MYRRAPGLVVGPESGRVGFSGFLVMATKFCLDNCLLCCSGVAGTRKSVSTSCTPVGWGLTCSARELLCWAPSIKWISSCFPVLSSN